MTSRKGKTTTRERSGTAAASNAKKGGARKTATAAAKDETRKTATSATKDAAAKTAAGGAKRKGVEKTADGHHVLIDGRRWRATDPSIPQERRQQLVNELMQARRDVGSALRAGDAEAEREARRRVHECKVALGERGAKWWEGKK